MKTNWSHLESWRKLDGRMASREGDLFGAFYFRVGTADIIAIASNGSDEVPWEHVSLRARDYKGERCPTWAEMCHAKDLFWEKNECVVQFHPPEEDYVNHHKHVLHLWKPINLEMPRPPKIAV
jgi:hypothetical protein